MKILRTLVFSCLLCSFLLFVTSISAHAADDLSMIGEALEDASNDLEVGGDGTDMTRACVDATGETVMLGDAVTFTLPADWAVSDAYAEDEHSRFQFVVTDEDGNRLLFAGAEANIEEIAEIEEIEEIEERDAMEAGFAETDETESGIMFSSYAEMTKRLAERGTGHLAVNINGVDMVFVSEYSLLAGVILSRDGRLFVIGFELDEQFVSRLRNLPKLRSDISVILRSMKPVNADNLQKFDTNAPEFQAVKFQNEEMERMVRSALGKPYNTPVYPTELTMVRKLRIRTGGMTFGAQVKYDEHYEQLSDLDLSDLTVFPNLEFLYVCDMKCIGLQALPKLKELRNLVLIRTGLTECGFLADMTLRNLDLAGNTISDFSPLANVEGLKTLNLCETGLTSLGVLQGLDLTGLVIAANPVEDLSPLAGMSHLEKLNVSMTRVKSLGPIRCLSELKELDIRDLEGVISLEPLHGIKKLERIDVSDTTVVDDEELKDILE